MYTIMYKLFVTRCSQLYRIPLAATPRGIIIMSAKNSFVTVEGIPYSINFLYTFFLQLIKHLSCVAEGMVHHFPLFEFPCGYMQQNYRKKIMISVCISNR